MYSCHDSSKLGQLTSAADRAWVNGFLGAGVEVVGGNMQDLYSMQSEVTTGRLKHDKKIDELHACTSDGFPTCERDLLVADFGIVWRLYLKGQEYLV